MCNHIRILSRILVAAIPLLCFDLVQNAHAANINGVLELTNFCYQQEGIKITGSQTTQFACEISDGWSGYIDPELSIKKSLADSDLKMIWQPKFTTTGTGLLNSSCSLLTTDSIRSEITSSASMDVTFKKSSGGLSCQPTDLSYRNVTGTLPEQRIACTLNQCGNPTPPPAQTGIEISGLSNGACPLRIESIMLGALDNGRSVGDLALHWQETLRAVTNGGDAVLAGYFYAPPDKVSWGQEGNPEIYTKIWFSRDGNLSVNFFHVGVFDTRINTRYNNAAPDLIDGGKTGDSSLISIGQKAWRYVRHDYNNWQQCN